MEEPGRKECTTATDLIEGSLLDRYKNRGPLDPLGCREGQSSTA